MRTMFTAELAVDVAIDRMRNEADRIVLISTVLAKERGLPLADVVATVANPCLEQVWHSLFDALKAVGFHEAIAESAIIYAADVFTARVKALVHGGEMQPGGHA